MTAEAERDMRADGRPEEVVLVPVYRGGAAFARFLDELLEVVDTLKSFKASE